MSQTLEEQLATILNELEDKFSQRYQWDASGCLSLFIEIRHSIESLYEIAS